MRHDARTQKVLSKGGPTQTTFFFCFLMGETEFKIALKAGHHRPASETPFKWRFAGESMMAHLNGVSQAGQ